MSFYYATTTYGTTAQHFANEIYSRLPNAGWTQHDSYVAGSYTAKVLRISATQENNRHFQHLTYVEFRPISTTQMEVYTYFAWDSAGDAGLGGSAVVNGMTKITMTPIINGLGNASSRLIISADERQFSIIAEDAIASGAQQKHSIIWFGMYDSKVESAWSALTADYDPAGSNATMQVYDSSKFIVGNVYNIHGLNNDDVTAAAYNSESFTVASKTATTITATSALGNIYVASRAGVGYWAWPIILGHLDDINQGDIPFYHDGSVATGAGLLASAVGDGDGFGGASYFDTSPRNDVVLLFSRGFQSLDSGYEDILGEPVAGSVVTWGGGVTHTSQDTIPIGNQIWELYDLNETGYSIPATGSRYLAIRQS